MLLILTVFVPCPDTDWPGTDQLSNSALQENGNEGSGRKANHELVL